MGRFGKRCGSEVAPRVLFLQCTDAAAYPPVINAAMLLAEAGWRIDVLSTPWEGMSLAFPHHPSIRQHAMLLRPNYVVRKSDYARYVSVGAQLALRLRPDVVYASDPLGCGPGLIAARLAGSRLVYHEHDTPGRGALPATIGYLRREAARAANVVIFPNAARAEFARADLGFDANRLRIVWNLPRRSEIRTAPILQGTNRALQVYFHGSITPDRVPLVVVEALRRLAGGARLRIAGYEAPSAVGFVAELVRSGGAQRGELVEYIGQVSREGLINAASRADVGLALMPLTSPDVNMRHMVGASNKAFDYMAAGLAMLVSDLPEWRETFLEPGFAYGCDPSNVDSVEGALRWMIDHPQARAEMGARNQAKIQSDWNYDTAFAPVLAELACGI